MVKASDLRIGNKVFNCDSEIVTVLEIRDGFYLNDNGAGQFFNTSNPIPLTGEILEGCGFVQHPHFTVQNLWYINIGRDRVISVACVGTFNEMVFINEEEPPVVKNIIVARNYDYDGKTHLHQLQNLYHSITGKELPVQFKK